MAEKEALFDVTIIGGGPIGLFISFCCGMRGLSAKIIEADKSLGGKVTRFYPEKYIYDVGGIPGKRGDELVEDMVSQAFRHNPDVVMDQVVEDVAKQSNGVFCLTTNKGEKHYSKTVIAGSGMGRYDIIPLEVPGVEEVEDSFLHYQFSNLPASSQSKVAVISDHRAGVDWALALEKQARKVYLINPKNAFAGTGEEDLKKLAASSVEVFYHAAVSSLRSENGSLNSVVLSPSASLEEKELDVTHMFVYQGVKFTSTPYEEWGVESEKNRVTVDAGMESNVKGFYAAGDAAIYPQKSLLIANGYAEAITAVNSAALYLDEKAPAQVYSTVVYRNL